MTLKEKELNGLIKVSKLLHPKSNISIPLNEYSPYDGVIITQGKEIVCEYKYREKYSSFYLRVSLNNEILLEKKKYESIIKLKERFDTFYYITEMNDNVVFVFDMSMTPIKKDVILCPKSTLWDQTKINKEVYLINTKNCIRKIEL